MGSGEERILAQVKNITNGGTKQVHDLIFL